MRKALIYQRIKGTWAPENGVELRNLGEQDASGRSAWRRWRTHAQRAARLLG